MALLRIAGLLTIIFIAACAIAYAFTGNKRYLHLAVRVGKYALWVVLALFGVLFVDRLFPFL